MGKIKNVLIVALSVACPILMCCNSKIGGIMLNIAYIAADYSVILEQNTVEIPDVIEENYLVTKSATEPASSTPDSVSEDISADTGDAFPSSTTTEIISVPEVVKGTVIEKNRSTLEDTADYSLFTENSGAIDRYTYERFTSTDYITLDSGAQVRNCTEIPNSVLENASDELPDYGDDYDYSEPQVLIYHTHTSESFLPYSDSYDEDYPICSVDDKRNITAVGDAVCDALAERGISVVHDCRVHDSPMFTGAYYRSAETVLENLEEYPSIKLVIDIHRDGIVNDDGSLCAPVAEINGKNAAQFMIIACCDNGEFDMPDYMENYRLACLLQNCSERAYPNLARPMLFDYRNYNQSLSTGALLIEVGSHGNSLEEAVYSGELLGNVIADALKILSKDQ